jgi:galactonate dehydratase
MKIARVEAFPIRLPRELDASTGTAGSPTPLAGEAGDYRWSEIFPCLYSMKFETALVRVTTTCGVTAWGEAQAPLAPEVACEIVRLLLAPVLEGTEFEGTVEEIETLWQRMYQTMRVRGHSGGFMLDAISGVDIALWDLAGKIQNKPVARMLRESPKSAIPAYVSGLPAANRAGRARELLGQGFRKFKLFFDTRNSAEFFAVLDEMPPEAEVAVDGLWRFTLDDARQFGWELDSRRALWFEAPLAPEDAYEHAYLAWAIGTPVAIGESYRTAREVLPFFHLAAVGVLQPDLGRCGITEGRRMASLAANHSVPVVPHISIALGPQIAAALHFGAAMENCALAEYNPQVLSVANRFLVEPLRMEGSCYAMPEGPGLGIEVDAAVLP